MSIPESFHFDKSGEVVRFPAIRKYFLTLLIALLVVLSYGVGRLSAPHRGGVSIVYPEGEGAAISQLASVSSAPSASAATPSVSGQVYASSKGTRYYYMSCKSSVSDKNRIVFNTAKEAEAAGYTLSATCKPQ
jgi:hypothetical protein